MQMHDRKLMDLEWKARSKGWWSMPETVVGRCPCWFHDSGLGDLRSNVGSMKRRDDEDWHLESSGTEKESD